MGFYKEWYYVFGNIAELVGFDVEFPDLVQNRLVRAKVNGVENRNF